MLRGFALTAAGISLRVQLGLGGAFGMPVDAVHTVVAWTCWVPNVFLAELWLWPTAPEVRRDASESESVWPATQMRSD